MEDTTQTSQAEISAADAERSFIEQVWQSRAERLARVPSEEGADEQTEVLLLRLGSELYAMEAIHVYDIRPHSEVTPVPRVPDWMLGLSNIRGKILSVIDLRQYFKLPAKATNGGEQDQGYQVLVQDSGMELALAVDEVFSVESIPTRQIRPASGFMSGIRPEYIRGTYQHGNRSVTILNLPALLGDHRMIIEEQI